MIVFCSVLVLLSSCGGCKKDPEPPEPNLVEQLNNEYKPLADSLARENRKLQSDRDSLKVVIAQLELKKQEIRSRKEQAAGQVVAAEIRKDTAALVASLKDEIKEAEAFIETQEHELQVQGASLMKAEKEVANMKIDAFLATQKNDRLAKGYNDQEAAFTKTKGELIKSRKETKKAKVWKNIFGGVAVVLGVLVVASH